MPSTDLAPQWQVPIEDRWNILAHRAIGPSHNPSSLLPSQISALKAPRFSRTTLTGGLVKGGMEGGDKSRYALLEWWTGEGPPKGQRLLNAQAGVIPRPILERLVSHRLYYCGFWDRLEFGVLG